MNAHVPKRPGGKITCWACNGSGNSGHMQDCKACNGRGCTEEAPSSFPPRMDAGEAVEFERTGAVRIKTPPGMDSAELARQIRDIGESAQARLFATEAQMRQVREIGCGRPFDFEPYKGRVVCGDRWEGAPVFCSDACLTRYKPSTPEVAHVVAMPPTAAEILRKAADTMEERGRQYDSPTGERSMGKAVKAFNAITGRDLKTEEGWLLMGVVKSVRQYTSGKRHEDSAIDHVAYAALEAEEVLEGLRAAENKG